MNVALIRIDFLCLWLKRGLFLLLFSAGTGLSYLGIQKLIYERDEIMRLYWRELLGKVKPSHVDSFYPYYFSSARIFF